MFALRLLLCFYFAQFSYALHGSGGLFGLVFGFQKLCFCRCGIAQRHLTGSLRNGRLLGGEAISPHQFPWLVSVNTGSQNIGGTLLSERHVVTAASVLYGIPSPSVTVTIGEHDRCGIGGDPALKSSVAAIHLHPGYSPTNMNNDIALLRLRHMVAFSKFVSPICMPHNGFQEVRQVAWTAAWILNSTDVTCVPRVATLPVLPSRACFKGAINATFVTSDKGCLGPLGSKSIICKADVGAPVMTRGFGSAFSLIGIMSSSSSCDQQVTPLYTRIVDHIAWIYSYIHADCQCF